MDYYYTHFSGNGFDGIKLDFLSHGIVEGGSNDGVHYVSTVQTGVQAYNYGMAYLAKKFGATMYIDESIAPIFPYQYAHARRVSCDTFGQMGTQTPSNSGGPEGGTTSYEMNSATYGWWLAGRLYNFNDPDQIVMEGFLNIRIRPWLRRLVTRSLARSRSCGVAGFSYCLLTLAPSRVFDFSLNEG